MPLSTITSKGQVTLPKAVRQSLGLQPGDKIEFVVTENGQVLVRPITRKVDEVFGKLHRSGRKAASVEVMDDAIKKKLKTRSQR